MKILTKEQEDAHYRYAIPTTATDYSHNQPILTQSQ